MSSPSPFIGGTVLLHQIDFHIDLLIAHFLNLVNGNLTYFDYSGYFVKFF